MKIYINNKKIKVREGQTIFEACKENGIEIPTLCFHPDLKVKAYCRICVVQIEGRKGLYAACSTKTEEGMKITTESEEISRARKINLELIFSQHQEECYDCVWNSRCQLLELAKKYEVEINKFQDRKKRYPVYNFGPVQKPILNFDSTKCIDCRNCVEICEKQGVGFLELQERGNFTEVFPSEKKEKDCVYCGQCITHCPAGSFEAEGEFEEIEKPFRENNGKLIIFQIAPSIRTSIGEEFGMEHGTAITDKLVAGIKKLGADKVFDVSVGADFTTIEEAKELKEKLETGQNMPMFTSCCPAWVKYVEFYYPEFMPNLTSARSPQMMSAGLIKTYFSEKNNISPENIFLVSVMPCISKKYEIQRPELEINGAKLIDYVMTTRELARLFIKRKIDLNKIKPQKADSPFASPSGAGVIYGASGGVMESVLRTAHKDITGKELKKIEFKEARGKAGIKGANIYMGNREVRIAVASGLGNGKKILESLKKSPNLYDCIEVMACPGGCVGGGGQPLPTSAEIRKKRAEGLYKIDKKGKVRLAHKNPEVKEIYKNFLTNERIIREICHTTYSKKEKK